MSLFSRRANIQDLYKQIDALKTENDSLRVEIHSLKADYENLRVIYHRSLDESNKNIKAWKEEYNKLNEELKKYKH